MRLALVTAVVLLSSMFCATVQVQQRAAGDYPRLEVYYATQRLSDYPNDAAAYLQRNAMSPYASRVAYDMYMYGTLTRNASLVNQAQQLLVFLYAGRVEGTFFRRTIGGADAYRNFVAQQAAQAARKRASNFPQMLALAVDMGIKDFGDDMLSDDGLVAVAHGAALIAKNQELGNTLSEQLKKDADRSSSLQAVINDQLNGNLTLEQRVKRLEPYKEYDATARTLQTLYLTALGDQASAGRALAVIDVDNMLGDNMFSEAVGRIGEVEGFVNDAELMTYRGWGLFAIGERDVAVTSLRNTAKAHGDSPWAKQATLLADVIASSQANITDQAEALSKAVPITHDLLDRFEISIAVKHIPDRDITITFGYQADTLIRVAVIAEGKPVYLMETTAKGSRIWVHGDKQIVSYVDQPAYPYVRFSATRAPDQSYNWGFITGFGRNQEAFIGPLRDMLESDLLSSKDGLSRLITGMQRRGMIPSPILNADGATTCVWSKQAVGKPAFLTNDVRIDKAGRIIGFRFAKFETTAIKYGDDAAKLSELPWPDLPVVESPTLTNEYLAGLFARIIDEAQDVIDSN